MRCFFISDLHLSPHTPNLVEGFKRFVNSLNSTDTLYILGDFFDAWIGDDEDTPVYLDIQFFLKSKTDAGLTIYFMKGNRDFTVGQTFSRNTGLKLLKDPTLTTISGQRLLLMHGDSLCIQDKHYMRFRAVIRNPIVQSCLLALPLSWRRRIADSLRGKSKNANAEKSMTIMDVDQKEVQRVLEESGADILVHGHTHRPGRHRYGAKERIVLGDWGATGWSLCIDDTQMVLSEFSIA